MTNSFRGPLLLMPIGQGGSAAPRAMLIRREGAIILTSSKRLLDPPKLRNTGLEPVFLLGERRAFSGKKPRDHAHSRSPQMRKGRNLANSDFLFVRADDVEKNPEHENEPRWKPNPVKIIKVTPQKADFRLRKCQRVICDHAAASA